MPSRSLAEWLEWQESLNLAEIDLGLERVAAVAARLDLAPPAGHVFTIAGTNGKGSCAAALSTLLSRAGHKTGVYSSPHLMRYNERVSVAGMPASDAEIVAAFDRIEAVRQAAPLTFFEYGTLAAMVVFAEHHCDAWVLEVGLGGRLDAVNLVDPDYSIITTVDLDHQQWLGDTIEEIAAEKAGIMRPHVPAFYGDRPLPDSIREKAGDTTPLYILDDAYRYSVQGSSWSWQGQLRELDTLPLPAGRSEAQVRNISLALAVAEKHDAAILDDAAEAVAMVNAQRLPGRFQVVDGEHQWVLDVAHNRQAAGELRRQLETLAPVAAGACTVVSGMLEDKQVEQFAAELSALVDRWVCCPTSGPREQDPAVLARRIDKATGVPTMVAGSVPKALEMAVTETPADGRIIVCGSFTVVGPALEWLGLY